MTNTITAIMHRQFLALDPQMPIRQAAGLLHASGQDAAAVVDDAGALIGILTQKDCFRPALEASYYRQWRGTVGEQMSAGVITVDADADIVAAAQMFLSHPHRAFPALQSGQLAGMLYRKDLLGAMLELG